MKRMWFFLAVVGLAALLPPTAGFIVRSFQQSVTHVRLTKAPTQQWSRIPTPDFDITKGCNLAALLLRETSSANDLQNLPLLVEEPSKLESGTLVEYIHNSEVCVGRVARVSEERKTLDLEAQDMAAITIPHAQVISIWEDAEEDVTLQWETVRVQAEALLNATSPRKRDLQEFWEIVSQQRSSRLAVDSVDVGVYLFQESRLRAWLNPFSPDEAANVRPLTLAQRYAAARLLHSDDGVRFKRRPSAVAASAPEQGQPANGPASLGKLAALALVEGGYRVLPESVVLFKQSCQFEKYYTERLCNPAQLAAHADSAQSEAREAILRDIAERRSAMSKEAPPLAVARILRQLELYALCVNSYSGSNVRRGGPRDRGATTVDEARARVIGRVNAPKLVRAVLRRLNMPETPLSARRVLVNLNQRATPGYTIDWRAQGEGGGNDGAEGLRDVSPLMQVPLRSIGAEEERSTGSGAFEGAVMAVGGSIQAEGAVDALHAAQNSVTAWSPAVTEASQKLARLVERDNKRYAKIAPGRPGKRGPSGRMDYRGEAALHPPICVDARHASFLDDCFSLSPDTSELLVHVVDVAGRLSQFEALQEVCRERVSSLFLPAGPLHMLPPAALNALTLSADPGAANEVLTVALSVHPDTGEILSFRVFPSVLGPVYPLDMRTADDILSSGTDSDVASVAEKSESGPNCVHNNNSNTGMDKRRRVSAGRVKRLRFPATSPDAVPEEVVVGHPTAVVEDLRAVQRLVRKICARDPLLGTAQRQQGDRQSGGASLSQGLVDTLLRLYSGAAMDFCTDPAANGRVAHAVPVVWENRDRTDSSKVRRFATQPLRNWISQLQQRQVRAALRMEPALTKKECAMAVLHHNFKRKQQAQIADRKALYDPGFD